MKMYTQKPCVCLIWRQKKNQQRQNDEQPPKSTKRVVERMTSDKVKVRKSHSQLIEKWAEQEKAENKM